MILKAKERGNAPQLGRYLMGQRDNDHVELHEVRGFISDDLHGAFLEAHGVAQGTRSENYLFSMSFNPPLGETASTEQFEKAFDQVERKLGLDGQPRAVIFHEKDGRRHAHVVWSKVDTESMTAINLPYFKAKLRDVSRSLFLENGWEMPRGLEDKRLRDPLQFSQAEWQQARRAGVDPKELKAVFQKAWEASDDRASFQQAMAERGFKLANGDRRGFVAVDYRGEVYSVARLIGVRTKAVKAKLGDPDELQSVTETRKAIAEGMTEKLQGFIRTAERYAQRRLAQIEFRKAEVVGRHRAQREDLTQGHAQRWQAETNARAARLPKGISGVWHRLTGRYGKIRSQNEREALEGIQRDRAEKDALVSRQLDERQRLQHDIDIQRKAASDELAQLREDVVSYMELEKEDHTQTQDHENDHSGPDDGPSRNRSRRSRRFEP